MLLSLIRHRDLIRQLARRELLSRYRTSYLGLGWALLVPLATLLLYGFVFGAVLRVRWPTPGGDGQFIAPMFTGMIVYLFVAECLTRAPTLIVARAEWIKKVAFPSEVLGAEVVLTALVPAAVSTALLLAGQAATGGLGATALWLIPLWLLLGAFALGLVWLLAALGAFVRDLAQATGLISSALLLLSPVMFPLAAVPPAVRPLVAANPLTPFVEASRAALIDGRAPDALQWIAVLALGAGSLALGAYVFHRAQGAFADVL
jgi:lipopolysaccharide transport system permease protein